MNTGTKKYLHLNSKSDKVQESGRSKAEQYAAGIRSSSEHVVERFHQAMLTTHLRLGSLISQKLDNDLIDPQCFILSIISKEQNITVSHLADKMEVKPSAITVMLAGRIDSQTDRIILYDYSGDWHRSSYAAANARPAGIIPEIAAGCRDIVNTFFRQIGGTFGMTLLGVMNMQSSSQPKERLIPLLGQLPEEAKQFADQTSATVASNPQAIYSTLLDPKVLAQFPKELTDQMVPVVQATLVDSLHSVFWVGLVFILIGTALTLYLKNVKIVQQPKEENGAAASEPQLNHI